MKDQYFGDVNDYRKYGLLRALAAAGLSIGVCWLLTPDDGGSDGGLRRYLDEPSKWRRYDPDLYDMLQRLKRPDTQRTVRHCSDWGLVPGSTCFDDLLADDERRRDHYFQTSLGRLGKCDIIFFDPDNGTEVTGTPRGRRGSSKYVYWIELRQAFAGGSSVLVYQHYPRVERSRFVPFLADRLGEEIGAARVDAFATPHVVFLLAHQGVHEAAADRAAAAVQAAWHGQIDVWPSTAV